MDASSNAAIDNVNHPKHYQTSSGLEAIDVIDSAVGPTSQFGIAFRKDDTELQAEVQKAFDEVVSDGTGQKISEQQFKSWVGKSKWLTQIKNAVELGNSLVDNGIPALNAATTLDVTSDALNIFPGVKTFAGLAGIIDKFMSKREHDKNLDSHAEIRDELNRRLAERNSFELEKFLPFLFAQDVSEWLELSGNKLIIFLETYELLEGAIGSRIGEHNLYRDWWIRSEAEDTQGLTILLPDTLWVISGRNELSWKGELAEEIKPNLLEPLTQEDSLEFLTKAKVEPPELREEIFK